MGNLEPALKRKDTLEPVALKVPALVCLIKKM
jgi:hypothetical protein